MRNKPGRSGKPNRQGAFGQSGSFIKKTKRKSYRDRETNEDDNPAKKRFSKSSDEKGYRKSNNKFSKDDKKSSYSDDKKPRRKYDDDRSGKDKFDRNSKSSDRGFGKSKYDRESKSSDKEFGKDKYDRKSKFSERDSERNKYDRKDKPSKFSDFSKVKDKSEKFEKYGEKYKKDKSEGFSKGKPKGKFSSKKSDNKTTNADSGLVRLNKYLANAGISSRRDADTLIQSGVVKVNGVIVDQLGYKVKPGDVVSYSDAVIKNERKVYLLLNKPKDYITTTDDPQSRKTVMSLVDKACKERIYPVGRLDRNTTGLLLFTNDGDLAMKLSHPKHEIAKVYHVSLNRSMKPNDFAKLIDGFELEDGPVKIDDIAFVGEGRKEVGLEIHSGKNRIVRRIFEHLGYEVVKLDRVVYAGLTKKDIPRGKYRFLTEKEISFLKMLK
ncbi:MAG: pseudouridine synthase [Bacteroidia bacterium]